MDDHHDFLSSLGPLGLTLRLKRLADRFTEDARRLYGALNLVLEPNWHAVLLLLAEHEPLTVTQVASHLGLSHPSIVSTSQKLEKAGYVVANTATHDRRRRMLQLSEEGRARLAEFRDLWDAFRDELADMIEVGGGDLMAAVQGLETQLARKGLDQRVRNRLARQAVSEVREKDRPDVPLQIRHIDVEDRKAVVRIARELVRSADTYAFDPNISDEELWQFWNPKPPGQGFVATLEGEAVATCLIRPNHAGPGSHVANAGYAVRADMRSLGIGRRLGEASLGLAAELGFSAMQFNKVLSSNVAAVKLWRSLGFRIIGTIPDGFRLPSGEMVSYHIMYRTL
ncbi:Bifunctional helix-turn-helix transcriptional regulator/GNAT family N-acetyltransferase [Sulfidibacter corallicola]|uniref:Bifunctional helix-turn-helix transcriptional regulator/GNAT family N-acetyltransferase n=1 Tax=Sulfidibacter corallicola TaxID=2818388 RepID=A0A8A4TJ46_SULCO|nr:bifunctional helix-turn-helix transcriptional regulator/GNAT family N-acetyltransferase [Sulfidibacter corallicola]QTD49507.1 bifunctional helix-turn-helix transcriptional regulator/GNAT family N-acetyltransferase [Sulfidibacter corallicola]